MIYTGTLFAFTLNLSTYKLINLSIPRSLCEECNRIHTIGIIPEPRLLRHSKLYLSRMI